MRRGFSLVELALVLALVGTMMALATPRLWAWRDQWAVERATRDLLVFYDVARYRAIMTSRRLRLEFSSDSLRLLEEGPPERRVLAWAGPTQHGVQLVASRRHIAIGPTGMGWGGANTKIVLRRGAAGDSLTTSRLGRLKRW
jgi:prepilin-type N-terminal cleavage/methylation domain-containing protein